MQNGGGEATRDEQTPRDEGARNKKWLPISIASCVDVWGAGALPHRVRDQLESGRQRGRVAVENSVRTSSGPNIGIGMCVHIAHTVASRSAICGPTFDRFGGAAVHGGRHPERGRLLAHWDLGPLSTSKES